MSENILITGCNGFAAKYLANFLRTKRTIVYGIDLQESSHDNWIKYYKIDILDIDSIRKIVKENRINQIYHLAALSDPRIANLKPNEAVNVNVNGSLTFFEICKELNDVSLLVTGSTNEYKEKRKGNSNYSEEDSLNSDNIYGATKIATEIIGRAYEKNYKIKVMFTRSSNHSGSGQSTAYVLSNFAKQCADIARNKQSHEIYVGNIDIYRDFLDVEDVVEAYHAIMQKGKLGRIYNVSSNNSYLIRDLLNILISFTGCNDIVIKVDQSRIRLGEPKSAHYKTSLISEDTGWQPKIKIKDTLKKLYYYWYNQ